MLRTTISNLGNRSSSQAVASSIMIGGQPLALPNTGRIPGAQESTVVAISWTPTSDGTVTLDAQVDPANAETESNETDNHFSLPLTVNNEVQDLRASFGFAADGSQDLPKPAGDAEAWLVLRE